MKKRFIFLLFSISFILYGCATLGVVKNVDNYSQSLQDSSISISSFYIAHQSVLGKSTGLIGALIDSTGGAEVNPEAFTMVQSMFKGSNLFNYKNNAFEKTWDKSSKDNAKKTIEEMKLNGSIDVNIVLVLKSAGLTSGKIISYGHWKIIGIDGEEKTYIRTFVEDDEVFSGFNPSTKELEHKTKVMRVIQKSTNSFLSYLRGSITK